MTSIILTVTGAQASASVTGTLTSGTVGIPVTIEYDEAWDGLTKNLVCRCSQWGSDSGENRAILNVGNTAAVAPEVMKADMYLYLGIEGFSDDGMLVMPTTWAKCGKIQYGANTGEDLSTNPTLPVWNQLQTEIEQIKRDTVTQELVTDIQACAKSATQAASSAARSEENAENLANAALRAQSAAEAAAERAEAAAESLENSTQGGLTMAQANALDGMLRLAKYESDPTGAYAAFCAAFGITAKTLERITAVYSGGEVSVGTALPGLTGVTVTAVYSDGSTETVTGYTLSGEIAEGSNTITVSYGGKTATITVVGVAAGDGGDEPAEPLYGRFWPPIGEIEDWNDPQWSDVENFAFTGYAGDEYVEAGLPGGMFIRLDKLQGTVYIRTLTNNLYGLMEQGSYSVYANSDGEISTGGFARIAPTVYRQFGGKERTMDIDGTTYYFMMFKFEIPAGQVGYFVSTSGVLYHGYLVSADRKGIDDAYKPYYTLFDNDPSDRITEPATEVA